MNIQQLLYEFVDDPTQIQDLSVEVKGLCLDTQKIIPGDLFFAFKGQTQDGRTYLEKAIQKGACALVVERENLQNFPSYLTSTIPVIAIEGLHEKISEIAGRYYGDPSHDLTVIGITGTNGKTTCAHLLANALTSLGKPCAVIGTLTQALTTPDAITLQAQLAAFKAQGMKAVAIEVSSHGLEQYRVQGIHFDSAIFTNLTQDHLDYHGSMEAYGAAKKKLFHFKTLKRMILNIQDPFTFELLNGLPILTGCPTVLYTRESNIPVEFRSHYLAITSSKIQFNPQGILAQIATPWGQEILCSKLLGDFNLSNLLCVLAELCFQDVSLTQAVNALSQLSAPVGRMQKFGGATMPLVLVDYAHTPDALYNALKVAREYCVHRLWCVFGCGGDRDRLKRPQMGQIAAKMADKIIITNDNPRHESEKQIIMDILQGIPSEYRDHIMIQEDRKEAIEYAIHHALVQDVILIAGKGHEAYQLIGDHTMVFSDSACVQACLGSKLDEITR